MLGRSDGTLNPNGVRFGSAEIYNIGLYTVDPSLNPTSHMPVYDRGLREDEHI